MAWKAEYSPSFSDAQPRFVFVRQILGLFVLIISFLILAALISSSRDASWLGPWGDWTAQNLVFVLGGFAAYVVPSMLAVTGFNLLLARGPLLHQYRSAIHGFGGLVLLISACGLITLHVSLRNDGDPAAVFHAGGLIGAFMVDGEGLDVARFLGVPGSFFLLYGVAILGIILFTERLIREAAPVGFKVATALILPQTLIRPFATMAAPMLRIGEQIRHGITSGNHGELPVPNRSRGRVLSPEPIRGIHIMNASPRAVLELPDPYDVAEEVEVDVWNEDESVAVEYEATPEARKAISPMAGRSDNSKLAKSPRKPLIKAAAAAVQPEFNFAPKPFMLPNMDLLAEPPPSVYQMSEEEAREISTKIEQTLAQFRIDVQVIEVVQGPTVTRFAMHIAPGIRVSKILALENDLALALKAQQVRVLAPIPGQAAVGIEVPNKFTNPVVLRELMESEQFSRSKAPLSFALGKNISGEPVIGDLAQMPHLLIAGATGAGKSVCLNTIIASMLFRNPPDRVKFVMIDPKRVELSIYQAIPHLLAPVVCEPRKAAAALAWTVEQMETRYKLLAEIGVRNIDGYNGVVNDRQPNKKAMGRELKFMPHIVVVIDELADLMMVAKNEVEEYIIRLAQMARAVGIHLILATQRPSVNVITGIIKANFPSRIAFRVSSKVDSRTILDMNGAQSLLGRGDMLYSPGGVKPFRLQGAYVSDEEIERLADYIRSQEKARYEKDDFEAQPTPAQRAKAQLMTSALGPLSAAHAQAPPGDLMDEDEDGPPMNFRMPTAGRAGMVPLPPADLESLTDEDLFDVALRLVLESKKASVSYIQRRLKIGYARAGRLMDMMEEHGIVGPYQGSKPRDIIVDPARYLGNEDDPDL